MNATAAKAARLRARRARVATRPRFAPRMPRQVPPTMIEREYAEAILAVVRPALHEALLPIMREAPALALAAEHRTDAARTDAPRDRIRDLTRAAQERLAKSLRPERLEALAEKFAKRTTGHNLEQVKQQIRSALGVDPLIGDKRLRGIVGEHVKKNVALIKDIGAKVARDVGKVVQEAVAKGSTSAAIAQAIQDRLGIGERRARLIARDQVGKLNSQVNAERQKELGVTRFIWRTARDERVRDDHRALDGKVFSYAEPPSEGLPGEEINCRCYAEPVMDDVLGEALAEPTSMPVESGPAPAPAPSAPVPVPDEPITFSMAMSHSPSAAEVRERISSPPKYRSKPDPTHRTPNTQDLYRRPDGTWSPERTALHDAYAEAVTAGVPTSDAPTVYMTGGGPASGKSTALLDNPDAGIPGRGQAAQVNSDEAKSSLPEYRAGVEAGDDGAASAVHEESSAMAKSATMRAIGSGHDVVLDGVGADIEKQSAKVAEMRGRGAARVVAKYVTVDVDTAATRAVARAQQEGRVIDEDILRDMHAEVSRTVQAAIDRGTFDELEVYDNDVPLGEKPSLIAAYTREGGLAVLNRARWEAFQARGKVNRGDAEDATMAGEMPTLSIPELYALAVRGGTLPDTANSEDRRLYDRYRASSQRTLRDGKGVLWMPSDW